MKRQSLVLVLILVVSLPAMATPTLADTDRSVVTIDNNHGLADDATISQYHSAGHAQTDLSQLDATLTVATDRDDVGLEDEMLPSNLRNDFVRIEYREDFTRTLRIHLPREYWVPYSMVDVESASSDHVARYEPVRGGEYLEIVVHVDEPADIVLPVQKDSSASYRAVERLDRNIERATGSSAFSGDEWTYIRGDEFANATMYELEDVENSEDAVVQYDSYKDDPDETWLNAPRGEDSDVGMHVMTRESLGNESVFLVATADDPPDVRYKPEGTMRDRSSGWINDALEIPKRMKDGIDGIGDILPLSVGVSV